MRSYRHRIVNFKFFSKQIEEKYIWNLEKGPFTDCPRPDLLDKNAYIE